MDKQTDRQTDRRTAMTCQAVDEPSYRQKLNNMPEVY